MTRNHMNVFGRYRWSVQELYTGIVVASGETPVFDDAMREVVRYASQYAEDGAVRWWVKLKRRTLAQGSIDL